MAIEPKKINYDVAIKSTNHTRSYSLPPEVYTSDTAVQFRFNILDVEPAEFDEGAAVSTVEITTRDGSFFQHVGETSLEGTTVVYDLKEAEGKHAGLAKIQLKINLGGDYFTSDEYEFKILNSISTGVPVEIYVQNWETLTSQANAYLTKMAADIEDFDVALETGVLATNIAAKLMSLETTYAPEIVSMRAQLAQTLNKSAITLSHMFVDNAARDAYFVANPSELWEQLFIKVGTGYQQRLGGAWQSATPILSEQVSASNQQITDTGNYFATDNTNAALQELGAHKVNTANPHGVTKTQVGLGNVDNTSDANKPVSTATQTALNLKADKTTTDGINTRLTAEETATANNKVSAVKGKTFADVDARFEDVEADTTAMGTNLVTNGDFSNGTTGWTPTYGSASVSNNVYGLTGRGTFSRPFTRHATLVPTGGLVYVRFRARVTNSVATNIGVDMQGTVSGIANGLKKQNLPVINTWYTLSDISSTSSLIGNLRLELYSSYADAATANGKTLEIQDVIAIDLTATFGAGNEPTAEQMDAILAKFPNSWFNGTASLFQAKAALNKLMAVDARTEFEARNGITNGDFLSGTTGWSTTTLASHTVSSGVSSFVANAKAGGIFQIVSGTGNKFYLAAEIKADSSSVVLRNNTTTVALSQLNVFQRISTLYTATNANVPGVIDQRESGWTEVQVKNVINIDLTKTFGAGKEPTLAEMDRLMARFPNSWFDGVKPIQTIETLYQEKANKVQEAWITPTLLNGWTNHSTDVLKMYKDEFGIVHIRGRIRGGLALTIIMTLPVGYRPAQSKYIANVASIGNIIISTKKLFMVGVQGGTDNRLFVFDGLASDWTHAESFLAIDISYRAEA